MFTFAPKGVCSKQIMFDIKDDCITSLRFVGGCPGNLEGIGRLVEGMKIDEVIERLNGITCGSKPTSCPDQLCQALNEYKQGEALEMHSAPQKGAGLFAPLVS